MRFKGRTRKKIALKEKQEETYAQRVYLQSIISSIRDALVVVNSDGTLRSVNKAALDLLGYKEDELIGQPLKKVFLQEEESLLYKYFQGIVTAGAAYDIALTLLTKQGKSIPVNFSGTAMQQEGKIIGVVGLARDMRKAREVISELEEKKTELEEHSKDLSRMQKAMLHMMSDLDMAKKEEFRASEAKYRLLAENLPQKIFIKDRNSVYVFCNKNYARDLNIEAEEIKGKADYDFHPKELAEKYRADDKRIMESGEIEEIEDKYIQDGVEKIVQIIKTPIKDEKGNVTGILGIFWDITERKQIGEALATSERRYRTLFESSKDAIFIADAQTRMLVDCNEAALAITGYSKEEILSMPADQLHPKDAVDATMEIFKRQARGEDIMAESVILTKAGQRIFVSIHTALVELQGKTYLMGVFRDVTLYKKAEEKIILAAEEWRKTFDSITDLMAIVDKDYRLVRVNKAFADFVRLEPAEVIGKFCHELVHGMKEPYPDCPYKEAYRTGKTVTAEFFDTFLNKYLEVSVTPIFDTKRGSVAGAVHFIRDISQRKSLEEKARKHMQELEVFYKASVGREERILELKKEIQMLKNQLGKKS
ncbi:MAG: PAS domain S-box protein [Candidatus Omnitrophica bacterium]|nr:PAS domain S-box protein [Candidatus Omnitrophota bacterium]